MLFDTSRPSQDPHHQHQVSLEKASALSICKAVDGLTTGKIHLMGQFDSVSHI
jgi:hypothetical protein